MIRSKMTFAGLRQLLVDLGFTETIVPKSHVAFRHEESGAEIMLPNYRSNQIVLPHHLATARIILDAKGLMDADDFEDRVAAFDRQVGIAATRGKRYLADGGEYDSIDRRTTGSRAGELWSTVTHRGSADK